MASSRNRSNTATMLHSIAEELGCAPELVGVVKTELKLRSRKDILHATQERMAQMAAQDEPATVADDAVEDKPKKEKKAGLTLSQRRALLILLDSGDEGVAPTTGFKALPYLKLADVGYAVATEPTETEPEGRFTLTPKGTERASEINPKYRVWSAGESVAGDESRPEAGTHRITKAEADAAKAAADAKTDEEPEPAVEEQEPVPAEIGEPVELSA